MGRRVNFRLMFTVFLSIADEAVLIALGIVILSIIGVEVPVWAIVTVAVIFLTINYLGYQALRKRPQMGFENMIGQSGLAVGPIARKGTIRVGRQLWWAMTKGERIEAGAEVLVVDQTGLKLTVVKK